eukprot:2022370-Prymnesium_polylepis.1
MLTRGATLDRDWSVLAKRAGRVLALDPHFRSSVVGAGAGAVAGASRRGSCPLPMRSACPVD